MCDLRWILPAWHACTRVRRNADSAWYPQWKARMQKLLAQPGVEYFGMVNASEVAKAYAPARQLTHLPSLACRMRVYL